MNVFKFKDIYGKVFKCLILSTLWTGADANSVDPDETARTVSSGFTLFAILFLIVDKPLFPSVAMSKFNNGGVHFRKSGMKG